MKRQKQYAMSALFLSAVLALSIVVSCASSPEALVPYEGATSKWDEVIDSNIPDALRADKLKQLGHQMTDLSNAISHDVKLLNERMMALHTDYNATAEQKQKLIEGFTQKRNAAFAQYRDIIFAMRSQVSPQEWKKLTK